MPDQSVAYKCPSCNAPLSFKTETQSFVCDYCGGSYSRLEIEAMTAKAEKTEPASHEHIIDEGMQRTFSKDSSLYMCPTCGAQVITDSELSASAICHYCHSPIVLSGRLSGEFCPDMIIPFKRTRENALEGFDEWTKKHKFFLAKGFTDKKSLEKIQGLYVPFWLADCVVEGNMTADCYKTISAVRRGDYIVKTESKHLVTRQGKLNIDGVPADGSSKADDLLMESIEPFNYAELVKFDMPYLSGHYAEKYDVSKEQIYGRIQARAKEATREEFKSTVKGYTRTVVLNESYNIRGIRWKYVMLPMWFLSYHYKDKMYYYAMNGQTGKFGGTLPINKLKLILFSFGIPFLIALALTLLTVFAGSL
ncbi:MAG: hypothetical protein NC394_02950 [Bacteroides sp.]|nr:hypothetical protein [Bacteroides sp.]